MFFICKGMRTMRFKNLIVILVVTVFLFVCGFLSSCEEEDSDDLFEMCGSGDSTMVGGEIDRNTIWKYECSPYIVVDTLVVNEGVNLIIEPGVVVKFDVLKALIVKGTLIAYGTRDERIIFTSRRQFDPNWIYSKNWNFWGGIVFIKASDSSSIKYCDIKYCYERAIEIKDCNVTISHCKIDSMFTLAETGPFYLVCYGSSRGLIEYNSITVSGCNSPGILCESPANPIIKNNNIRCGEDALAVWGGGFLDGNYLEAYDGTVDATLGSPVDQVGDGICNTTSTYRIPLFRNVDGVTNPRSTPNPLDW